MKKGVIITIFILALIASFALGAFLSYNFLDDIWGEKANKSETQVENTAAETNISSEESNDESKKSSNENSNDNNGQKVKEFSSEDLKVKGITIGSSSEDIVNVFGSEFDSKSYEEGTTGDTLTEMSYEDGLKFIVRTQGEDGIVSEIEMKEGCIVETARGISIGDLRSEVLKAYPENSILKNDKDVVVVGYPGDDNEYESKGRIYFSMDNDKVVKIVYANTYAE